jgi:hypothetical protein
MGVIPMAVVTVVTAAALWGGFLHAIGLRGARALLLLLLVPLPLSALINILVKRPLILGLVGPDSATIDLSAQPAWTLAVLLFVAPFTEEAVKLIPLAIPAIARLARAERGAARVGFGLGIGFGIGEALYLAFRVSADQRYTDTPWYAFTGYLIERLTACFIHGALTAIVVTRLNRPWPAPLLGYAVAVALHAAANGGPLLYQAHVISAEVAWVLVMPVILVLGVIFERLRGHAAEGRSDVEELYRRPGS